MIPKIIHYCWFGRGEKPQSVINCINSWKKQCPDFQLIEWNEDNFDYKSIAYSKEAYELKKWAFVSDVARLHALTHYGGIYMDTDVEILRPIDDLLNCSLLLGLESKDHISTAFIGAVENQPILCEFYSSYLKESFILDSGKPNTTTNVFKFTNLLKRKGLFTSNISKNQGVHIYPEEYFSPKDYQTGDIAITENTRAIHYFDNSWWTEEQKYRHLLTSKLARIMPRKWASRISRLTARLKYNTIKNSDET